MKYIKIINEDTYSSLQMTDDYLQKYMKIEVVNEIISALFSTIGDVKGIESVK
jgi:hypothetical protein